MTASPDALQRLVDRAEIYDVLARYFRGLDSSDPQMVRSCFAQDVEAKYNDRPTARGVEAVVGDIGIFSKFESGVLKCSTHFMGNVCYEFLDERSVLTQTNAIAFLVRPDKQADTLLIRNLRYLDRLQKDSGNWLITSRQHTLDWIGETSSSFAREMKNRLERGKSAR